MHQEGSTTVELANFADSVLGCTEQALADPLADGVAVAELPFARGATQPTVGGNGSLAAPLPISASLVPLTAPRRLVSGWYRGRTWAFQLELRVDIDRARSMKKVSGDFYSLSEATTAYAGSLILDNPTLTVTPTEIKIRGLGRYTFTPGFPVIQVIIERRLLRQPPSPAAVQFFSQTNVPGTTYICAYESPVLPDAPAGDRLRFGCDPAAAGRGPAGELMCGMRHAVIPGTYGVPNS